MRCSLVTVVLFLVFLVNRGQTQRRNFSNFPCPARCYCFKRTVRCMRLDLQDIPKTALQTVTLDLRFNSIRDVTPGTFKNHRNLVSLLLNNNLLTSLRNEAFDGLVRLQNLYLYKNRIRYLEPNVFHGLKRLERLYLQNNELEEFKPETFSSLPSLDRLNLYNNRIQHIPPGSFKNLPKLTRLRLDHNALVCDCEMVWLSRMLSDNSLQVSANCKYPVEMSGKSIIGMDEKYFHCDSLSLEIKEGPQDIQVNWGGTAVFTCKVQDPSASVVWMRDDKELVLDNYKYKMMNDGSLMIQNTSESDGGYYECMARNTREEVKSRPARMTVLVPEYTTQGYGAPRFTTIPETILVAPGEPEITLFCQAIGVPTPVIKWAKNGIFLSSSYKYNYKPDGSLVIRDIDPSDHGNYQCEASNINGRVVVNADVIIKASPVFTIQPENVNTQIGGIIRLECVATGTPTPAITWFRKDEILHTGGRIYISDDGSLLEIRDAKESDGSLYICEARNEMGLREVSASVTVKNIPFKPAKLVYKPYNIEAIVGSTIEMPCKAVGDPKPGLTWQKDGSTMQRTGRFKVSLNGNLYIYKVAAEDQGRYECTAVNEYGRDTASGYLTVKNIQNPLAPSGNGIGDQYVKIAFAEASAEVDRAINKTIDNLINNKGPHNPSELFRIIRYPDAPARELARAAEVYERTLVNIRKHVENGQMMANNFTTDFNYKEILSPEHLELIARLSGCMTHRLNRNCSDMCFHSKYRSIDGTCNNLQRPTWGASLTEFRRILKPIYEDGFAKPVGWDKDRRYYGFPKPSSRLVSTTLITTTKITPDPEITHMVMQWGQFLDHDIDHATPSVSSESWDGIDCKKSCDYAAPCYPMDVPSNDPRVINRRCIDFIRSSSICGSGMTSVFWDTLQPREQINQLTSFIDASQVYGYQEDLAKDVRDLNSNLGKLREGPIFPGRKPLLPYSTNQMDCRRNLSESTVSCFLAGDIRANEQVGLIAMHTIWMREHNRIAKELKILNPQWDTDMLYHESRKIIGAVMQHITYKHWLPIILGQKGYEKLGSYDGYDPNVNPSISNVFATAALRFGHTLINPVLHRFDWDFKPIREGHLPLSKAFFSPWRVVEEGGVDPLLRGLFTIAAKIKRPDENLNSELTETLFKTAHAVALDLAAMNIHRSRDHGIPGYIEFRKFCNMTPVDTFDDLRNEISDANVRNKLEELYGHPGNIDVFVGGILEDQIDGGKVGPLFQCLLIEQFQKLRDGDRFYYENPSVFKPEQLTQIKQYTLARVLCDNGDNITRITRDVFKLADLQGGFISCEEIPRVDLKLWSECCNDCRYSGQLNTISRLNARRNRRHLVNEEEGFVAEPSEIEQEDLSGYTQKISYLERQILDLQQDVNKLKTALRKMKKSTKELETKMLEI